MDYLSINLIIVGTFLLTTLAIGLRAGRNIKDIREYAIANKMYGLGIVTITFLATYLEGNNIIGTQKSILTYGLIVGIPPLASIAMFFYAGVLIVPRMERFTRSITMGDIMVELYGQYGGVITGIMGAFFTVCIVGAQVVALGHICQTMLDWPAYWGIGVGGLVLITYSSVGGIKAVTLTDVFQFLIFIIMIPIIANIAISEVGGVKALFKQLPVDKLTVYHNERFFHYLSTFFFWCLFPAVLTSPAIIQRILMIKDRKQASKMLFLGASVTFVIRTLILLTSLSVIVLAPDLKPTSGGAFTYIMQTYFPPTLYTLGVVGMLAVIMSTVDSILNAGGLLLTHNVLKPWHDKHGRTFDELKWVRYVTFLMGCGGVIAAFHAANEVRTLGYLGVASFVPVITIPFVAGVMGLKTNTKTFLTSSVVTIIAFIIARAYLPDALGHLLLPISVLANGLSFFGDHYLRNGGIVTSQPNTKTTYTHSVLSLLGKAQQTIVGLLTFPFGLVNYTRSRAEHYGMNEMAFAFFMLLNYMLPVFMHSHTTQAYDWLFGIKAVGALLCIGILFKSYWPMSTRPYFPLYYYLTLLYCLPFATTFLFLLEGGSIEWLLNVGLAVMMLIVLANWEMFIGLSILGIVLASALYKVAIGPIAMHTDLETSYTLGYAITFSTLVGLLFARRKEQRVNQERRFLRGQGTAQQASLQQSVLENRKVLQALQNTGAGNLLSMIKSLHELDVKKADRIKLEALERELIPMAFQLQGIDTRSQDYLRLHIKEEYPIEELLNVVRSSLQESGIEATIKIANEVQYQNITGDFEQLATLLTKSIFSLQKLMKEEEPIILMSLKDTQLTYPLPDVEKNYIKHVPALRIAMTTTEQLPVPLPSYSPDLNGSTNRTSSETTQELDRMTNARIVKAHYGYAEVTDDTMLYVIPTDVTEVRPRDMDKAYMEVDATPKRANDHFVGKEVDAQAQEAAFLTDVAARSDADLGLVKMALELIKWYHGPSERKSGEPFYLHPLTVAHIVLDYDQHESTIIGALLHDTVEDTPMLLQHIETVFGKDTTEIVDLVTHLQSTKGSIYKIKMSASENLQMLDQAGNKRGLYVKIADRMHNMRTINGHKKVSKRKLVARETMDFFVPLARKLRLKEVAEEFEKMCEEVFQQKD